MADFETVERLVAELCNRAGGNWDAKRTKCNAREADKLEAMA